MTIAIVRTVADLRAWVRAEQASGHRVGLVPTMGALHDGHLSLVRAITDQGAKAVTTLFVNPKQFGPKEDLGTYPRDEAGDAAKLSGAGASLLFAPGVEEVYPDGFSTTVSVSGLGDILEGAYRPGFFNGVATVVSKLLLQALPDLAIFGEKDYQQLQVIRRMVLDLNIPVKILGGETIREPDGLAMSSRNAYLSAAERAIAPVLSKTLTEVKVALRNGADPMTEENRASQALLDAGFAGVDYVAVRDADSLGDYQPCRPGRVLAAALLGKARLIDNMAV